MIEETKDFRRVKRVTGLMPLLSPDVIYLVETEKSGDVGIWLLHPYAKGFMIHAGMGLECRGAKAIDSLKRAIEWGFKNLKCPNIYARIPIISKPACQVAARAGMEMVGKTGNGKLYKVENHGLC